MPVIVECECKKRFRAPDQALGKRAPCPNCGRSLLVEGKRICEFDVFLSHSHKDKTLADAVCARLEQHHIRCWLAPRNIPPGCDWGEAIIHGIERSSVFVLLFSSNSNGSAQVTREIERAASKQRIIIPFRIENVTPTKAIEFFISCSHWLDAITPPMEAHIERLAATVHTLIQETVHADHDTPTPLSALNDAAPISSHTAANHRKWTIIGVVGAAILLIFTAAVLLFPRLPAAAPESNSSSAGTDGAMLTETPRPEESTISTEKIYREMTPPEVAIYTALNKNTMMEMVDCPLQDCLEYVRDFCEINMILDSEDLSEVGLSLDVPVTLSINNACLRSGLNIMLKDLDLTYVVANEHLVITTPEKKDTYYYRPGEGPSCGLPDPTKAWESPVTVMAE